jgi:hypothetical protein
MLKPVALGSRVIIQKCDDVAGGDRNASVSRPGQSLASAVCDDDRVGECFACPGKKRVVVIDHDDRFPCRVRLMCDGLDRCREFVPSRLGVGADHHRDRGDVQTGGRDVCRTLRLILRTVIERLVSVLPADAVGRHREVVGAS